MDDTVIIKIVFGIYLSLFSAVLIFLAFALGYKYLIQEKRCTSKTRGIIKGYSKATYGGQNGIVRLPIVHYTVNGQEYKVKGPEYRYYVTRGLTTPFMKDSVRYREKNQAFILDMRRNPFVSIIRNPMIELYPLNSEIDIFYSPDNPKLAYVLRYCNKKWIFWLMFISGVSLAVIDLLILILL